MLLDEMSAKTRLNPLYRWASFTSPSANSFGLFVLCNVLKTKIRGVSDKFRINPCQFSTIFCIFLQLSFCVHVPARILGHESCKIKH